MAAALHGDPGTPSLAPLSPPVLRVRVSCGSGCAPCVTVVQSADDWQLDDFAHRGPLDRARFRCVLAQGQVRPARMVVLVDIPPQEAPKVLLAQYDDVVE